MAAYNDVLHVQMSDGVVDDGHHGEVSIRDEVGDVACGEDFSGTQSHDLVGGHTTVCTTDISVQVNSGMENRRGEATDRYSGFWPAESLTKKSGSSAFIDATHFRLLSKIRSWLVARWLEAISSSPGVEEEQCRGVTGQDEDLGGNEEHRKGVLFQDDLSDGCNRGRSFRA